jgi:sRNA-binding protein
MSNSATKAETAIAELVVAFPAAFTLDPTLVRPLKLGIKDDIYAQSAISRRHIKAALRCYCNSVHYLGGQYGRRRADRPHRRTGRNRDRDRGAARNGAPSRACQSSRQARR